MIKGERKGTMYDTGQAIFLSCTPTSLAVKYEASPADLNTKLPSFHSNADLCV